MGRYLITVSETYRVSTEEEAQALIEEAKSDTRYDIKKYSSEHKEVKETKTHDGDQWERVTIIKTFNDEREPYNKINISYQDPSLINNKEINF